MISPDRTLHRSLLMVLSRLPMSLAPAGERNQQPSLVEGFAEAGTILQTSPCTPPFSLNHPQDRRGLSSVDLRFVSSL
jgi:hypothetical protein